MHLTVAQIHIGNHLGVGILIGFYYLGKVYPVASVANEVIAIIVLSDLLRVVDNDGRGIAHFGCGQTQISAVGWHRGIVGYLIELPILQYIVDIIAFHSSNVGTFRHSHQTVALCGCTFLFCGVHPIGFAWSSAEQYTRATIDDVAVHFKEIEDKAISSCL